MKKGLHSVQGYVYHCDSLLCVRVLGSPAMMSCFYNILVVMFHDTDHPAVSICNSSSHFILYISSILSTVSMVHQVCMGVCGPDTCHIPNDCLSVCDLKWKSK